MATDIARISFDPARHYTGVAAQQGRVTLEAEQNEQRVIDAEERRLELIDIIGPGGTPDNGYALTAAASGFDFTIGPGTMYAGGLRVTLEDPIPYSGQRDWLDHTDDPDWIPPGGPAGPAEHIVLVIQERDVTAVEDPALREAALGGPDGSARTILLQHVERKPAQRLQDCGKALSDDEHAWASQGLIFDPATLQLRSESRLLVTWEGITEPPDPCEPGSTGGYLGAENQLIRVQVTAMDAAKGTFDLVWGWDNASFLYRVTADASTNPVLTLDRSPADDYHRPRAGQAVQVLRAAAELRSSDDALEGYVAALHGQVAALAAPYDPDTKTVQFPAPLPASYTDPKQTSQLYLRVWEEQLTGNTAGTPITLPGTGLQVTISLDGPGPVHVDDYWCIGVRPSTSTQVYPGRYLRAPQPPDGPRQWACPLAVISWRDGQPVVTDDCRHLFLPLPEGSVITQALAGAGPQFRAAGSGRRTIDVGPSDVRDGRLQQLIDAAVTGRPGEDSSSRVTISLQPGRYELQEPITLRQEHSNLTLRGCPEAAVISAAPGFETAFGQGLIVLVGANNVTITGLQLELPQVPAALARVRASRQQGKAFADAVNTVAAGRWISIGIRPVHCAVLAITDCLFRFSLGEHATAPKQTTPRTVFGVGVYAASECRGLQLERNRFLHGPAPRIDAAGPHHALVGYLLTPTAIAQAGGNNTFRQFNGSQVRALLHDAVIRDNTFDGLSAAAVALSEQGTIRIWNNIIRRCYAGICLIDTTAAALTDLGGTFEIPGGLTDQAGAVRTALVTGLHDPMLLLLLVFGQTCPLPGLGALTRLATPAIGAADVQKLQAAGDQARRDWMTRLVNDVTAGLPPAKPPPQGAAKTAATGTSAAAKPTDFNQGTGGEAALLRQGSPFEEQLRIANAGLAALARLAQTTTRSAPTLRIEDNDIACGLEEPNTSGPAALVYTSSRATSAEIMNNRMSSTGASPAASLIGVGSQAITGNIVTTTNAKATSLAIAASPHVAITGNIITGTPVLPANRPFPPPFDSWLPLNTIV